MDKGMKSITSIEFIKMLECSSLKDIYDDERFVSLWYLPHEIFVHVYFIRIIGDKWVGENTEMDSLYDLSDLYITNPNTFYGQMLVWFELLKREDHYTNMVIEGLTEKHKSELEDINLQK